MASPIMFKGLTLEQANETAKFHFDQGAKVSVSADGAGLFTVRVTYPASSADQSQEAQNQDTEPLVDFAAHVETVATQEWHFFGDQTYDISGHATHIGRKEGENGWYQRIGTYWLDGTNTHGVDGRNHGMPWSAAFISWVMKTSGAGSRFRYSTLHAVYIFQAIRDLLNNNAAAGFWCWRLNELKPKIGDLVCWSRQAGIDYDHQNNGDYKGHCDIVVEVLSDRVNVIGGNVGNSVTRRPLPLNDFGFLKPVTMDGETLFAIMQNRIA